MDTAKQVPATVHHPKAPGASVEALRQLSGIVTLTHPVPDTSMFDETSDEVLDEAPPDRARD
jgi:hypothetical protein